MPAASEYAVVIERRPPHNWPSSAGPLPLLISAWKLLPTSSAYLLDLSLLQHVMVLHVHGESGEDC